MANVKITDNSEKVLNALRGAKPRALEKIGEKAEGYAKRLCPVGTAESTGIPGYRGGTLRKSITHTTDDEAAYIGTNVEYAPYVELGTCRQKAQPYLRPAATEHQTTYQKIIQSELKNA